MYFRCADCLATTWINAIRVEGPQRAVDCNPCGRLWVVQPNKDLGPAVRDHLRPAQHYSLEQDLDLPSAYSVLLGIMSLEQAQVLRPTRLAHQEPSAADLERDMKAAEAASPRRKESVHDFDPGSARAIASGRLTVQQAMTRGEREAYASRLRKRHGLTEEDAYRVADNHTSLRAVLRSREQELRKKKKKKNGQRAAGKPSQVQQASAAPVASLVVKWTVAAFGGMVLAVVFWPWSKDPVGVRHLLRPLKSPAVPIASPSKDAASPASSGGQPFPGTEVRTDDSGQIVEIIGPDPRSVLLAYCASSPAMPRPLPIEITSTAPAMRTARLGVFLDFNSVGAARAIRIRRDSRTRRWVAGPPIQVIDAPELPPQAIRVPVTPGHLPGPR